MTSHAVTLILLSLVGGIARPSAQQLAESIDKCGGAGHSGYLVTLATPPPNGPKHTMTGRLDALERRIRDQSSPAESLNIRKLDSIATIAAMLEQATISEFMQREDIAEIIADCNIFIDPDELNGHPSTSQYTWGLDRIDQRALPLDGEYSDSGVTGAGSTVYVLDTGVRISHNDFGGRAKSGWSAGCKRQNSCDDGWVFKGVISGSNPSCSGHGTHCASTIGGSTWGVSKEVTIVTVQVLSCDGWGSFSQIMEGIQWAVRDSKANERTPAVISMSLGGSGAGYLDRSINFAFNQGVLTVVAAGNENDNACRYSPASTPNAITVGSTESTDHKSGFSNKGRCIDIHAPGSEITAAWKDSDADTLTISGTSMACPHVAGVAAQIRALDKNKTPAQVTAAIICLSTEGEVKGLPGNTVNKLLYNGFNSDTNGCLSNAPPASPSPAPPPPMLPSPPADPNGIPAGGVLVLRGNSDRNPLGCLMPSDADKTTWPGNEMEYQTIAAQCCTATDECRREVRGHGCVAGDSRALAGDIVEFTFARTEQFCTARGLKLCTQSCSGTGCNYNKHPVYSGIPCPPPQSPAAPAAPPSPPSPPSPPRAASPPPTPLIGRCVQPAVGNPYSAPLFNALDADAKIVGGVPVAPPRSFQYQVSLGRDHFCGGSLIAPTWVLTAAHCIDVDVSVVKVGMHDLPPRDDDECVQTREVKRNIRHPRYNPNKYDFDIALLELFEPVDYAPIALNRDTSVEVEGTTLTVSGWGDTTDGGSPPDELLKVAVPVVGTPACKEAYGRNQITPRMICAGEGGKDSCQGDSGGPLVHAPEGDGEPVLVGVVSWGQGCALPRFPGVYARVSELVDWVDQEMGGRRGLSEHSQLNHSRAHVELRDGVSHEAGTERGANSRRARSLLF